jgi:hypothetical protein
MRKHLAIAAIVAVLAVPGMRAAVAAGPQAGEVLALFGQCFVDAAGRRNLLKPGDAVHVGDTVDVAEGAKLKLRMNDGSVIAFASGSRVTIAEYSPRSKLLEVTTHVAWPAAKHRPDRISSRCSALRQ